MICFLAIFPRVVGHIFMQQTPEQFVFFGESKPLARSVTSQKKSVHIVKIAY